MHVSTLASPPWTLLTACLLLCLAEILLNRTFVYLKPVVTKGSDGTERHKTFKIQTPHQETVFRELSNPGPHTRTHLKPVNVCDLTSCLCLHV